MEVKIWPRQRPVFIAVSAISRNLPFTAQYRAIWQYPRLIAKSVNYREVSRKTVFFAKYREHSMLKSSLEKCFKMSKSVSKCQKVFQNVKGSSRSGGRCFKMSKYVSKCQNQRSLIRSRDPSVSKCQNLFQNVKMLVKLT